MKKTNGKILIFVIIILSLTAFGCLSELESTQKDTTSYTGIDYANVGFTTDGKSMYYNKAKGSENNIFLREIAGTLETALTYDSNENLCVRGAVYNNLILFSSNKEGAFRVYKMALDGTVPIDILRNSNYDFQDAAFSKDGTFVVFSAIDRADANYSQICMADLEGQNFTILTSTDSLKRKPTVSSDNKIVMFQKKVNNYWGLYYIDISKGDKIENEFLVESNIDSYDPEFLTSSAQTTENAEELVYIRGRAGTSVRMESAYFANKTYTIIKNFSTYYYFCQPAVSVDGSALLFTQKPLSGNRFDIWKTDLYATTQTQITK